MFIALTIKHFLRKDFRIISGNPRLFNYRVVHRLNRGVIMGSFSWLKADRTTKRNNLTDGDVYKILIPQEFGGWIYQRYLL